MQLTLKEKSDALRALEVVILDPRCGDAVEQAGIIKAVSKAIMPSRRKLEKAKKQREAMQCAKAATR